MKDRNAERLRLVDQIRRDGTALERDEALGQEHVQFVVSAKRCGAPVALPVGPAHHLVNAVALGPLRGKRSTPLTH